MNTTSAPYTPAVQYEYSTLYEGAGNYSRLTGVTYPGGTQVSYAYAGLDNSISRITSVADAGTTVETSQYLGLSTVVGVTEPNLMETTTLDTFGDTSDIAWSKGGSGLVNVAYGFDAVGDVLSRDDVAADNAGTSNLEQTYSYDTMHRLTGYVQGTFTAGTQSISSANTTVSAQLVPRFPGEPLRRRRHLRHGLHRRR